MGVERRLEIVAVRYASAGGFSLDAKSVIRKVAQKAPCESDVIEILDQQI